MTVEIIGYLPHTRQTETSGLWWSDDFDLPYIVETALAHEEAGFDSVLIGASSWGPDPWSIASHVLQATSRLKVLIAHRPGFIQPSMAARQAITLDRLSGGGRVALHIITGGGGGELERDGDHLPVAGRYPRTHEYMQLLRRMWDSTGPFDHSGEFYRTLQSFSPIRADGPLRLSFAGSSEAALDVGAELADLYMLWGEPLADTAQTIGTITQRAARWQRAPRFSVSLRAITGATEGQAWDAAASIYHQAEDELRRAGRAPESLQAATFRLDSVGARRLDAMAKEGDIQDERLWLGYTRLVGRGGSTSALVGTVDQVVDAYLRYYDAGAQSLYLRGWNIADDAKAYGQTLIPALREAVSAREATQPA